MGETTAISWTSHTFNPWIGCTKVSQGCKLCYAETQNRRYQWNPGGWGPGVPRKRTSAANWKQPYKWAKQARDWGGTRRVFCASLADIFDPEVSQVWRDDLFAMIDDVNAKYGSLEWLILTKRPENISRMLPHTWIDNPPEYVRIGVTAEDQENADQRIPELLNIWKGKNFISYEPALGQLDLSKWIWIGHSEKGVGDGPIKTYSDIHWLICGGESGPGCRLMDIAWARKARDQCRAAGIDFFFKQIGGHPDKQDDWHAWPDDMRIQQFPAHSP